MAAPDPAPDAFERAAGAVLVAAAVVALAPIVVVAGVVAWTIDRRGWRRWPVVVTGVAATTLAAVSGGWTALQQAGGALANHGPRPVDADVSAIIWLVVLGAAAGIGAAPLLLVAVQHRDDHEMTRRRRHVSDQRRRDVQARRVAARARWPAPRNRTVLGVAVHGGCSSCTIRDRTGRIVAVPVTDWGRQALIVGETGSGKTLTALAAASEAMRLGWNVYWIDGKADPVVAARFLRAAADQGLRAADGARDPIDGWRGGSESIVNRLLATQRFTEPYYAGIARNVLKWAVTRPATPRSFADLVTRMDQRALRRAWRDAPDEAEKIRALPAVDFLGARYRYEGVAWAVGATLDGNWSYEDVPAAYVPVGRPEHRDQAEEVGAFLLEDLLHWAMARKAPDRPAMVVVDEFSKLAARPDAAVELVERVRSFGVGVVLIGQTWASLGRSDAVRERLAGTVGTVITHQLKQPERFVELAGREWTLERTEQTVGEVPTGRATQRPGRRPVVHPDDVRSLRTGEAFLIRGGEAVKVRVRGPAPIHRPHRTKNDDRAEVGTMRSGPGRGLERPDRSGPAHAPAGTSVDHGGRDERREVRTMPMREDCRHFESRTYDSGEVARYCVLGLAPEQPWRCPEHCPKYEPSLIEGGMVTAPLARPPVEPEPDDDRAEIADVLQDAEAIVEAAEPDAIRELEHQSAARKPWQFWKRRRPGDGDGDDFNLSSR